MNEETPSQQPELDDEPDTIGQRIKYYRIHKGYSGQKLGRLANMRDGGGISKIERDLVNPSFQTVVAIARVLDLSLDTLAYGASGRTPVPDGIPSQLADFVADPSNWVYINAARAYCLSNRNSHSVLTLLRRLEPPRDFPETCT